MAMHEMLEQCLLRHTSMLFHGVLGVSITPHGLLNWHTTMHKYGFTGKKKK